MTNPIIVLKTNGKNEDVVNVTIKLFYDINEANVYCEKNTDIIKGKKHWSYCEIIKDGVKYEPGKYINYNCEY